MTEIPAAPYHEIHPIHGVPMLFPESPASRLTPKTTDIPKYDIKKYAGEIHKLPKLSDKQSTEMLRQISALKLDLSLFNPGTPGHNIAQKKLDSAVAQFAFGHLDIALNVAKQHLYSGTLDDLFQIAFLGLCDATMRYDSHKNASFETYAKIRVNGFIIDDIRSSYQPIKPPSREAYRVPRVIEELSQLLNREPTNSEIAKVMNRSIATIGDYKDFLQPMESLDKEREQEGYDDITLQIATGDSAEKKILETEEIIEIKNAVMDLPEQARQVILDYYGEGMTIKEIGNKLGVTESRISQILTGAYDKLRWRLRSLSDSPLLE